MLKRVNNRPLAHLKLFFIVSGNLSNCYIVIPPSICVFFIVLVCMRVFKIRGESLLLGCLNERLWLQILRKVPINILFIIIFLNILILGGMLELQRVVDRVEFSRMLINLLRLKVNGISPGHPEFVRSTIFFPLSFLSEVATVGSSDQSLANLILMLVLRNRDFFKESVRRYGLLTAIRILRCE